jgi:hypothetical protein
MKQVSTHAARDLPVDIQASAIGVMNTLRGVSS